LRVFETPHIPHASTLQQRAKVYNVPTLHKGRKFGVVVVVQLLSNGLILILALAGNSSDLIENLDLLLCQPAAGDICLMVHDAKLFVKVACLFTLRTDRAI
jgi:hypothetical protein